MDSYFASNVDKSVQIQTNGAILKRLRIELDNIIESSEQKLKELFEAEKEILNLNKPRVWNINIQGNMEIEMEVDFDKFLISVMQYTNEDMDKMSTFRFFVLVDYLKEKHTRNAGSNNKV